MVIHVPTMSKPAGEPAPPPGARRLVRGRRRIAGGSILRLASCLLLAPAAGLLAQDAPGVKPERERLRMLVEEGVVPRNALLKAAQAAEQARLEGTVRKTLLDPNLTTEQLPEMLAAAERLRTIAQDELASTRKLAEQGVIPTRQVEEAKQAADWAERRYVLAKQRAKLIRELSVVANAETRFDELEEEDLAFYSKGGLADWSKELLSIDEAFFLEFGRALPVSAKGETALHRSMGFDHSERVDVDVHPDQEEGLFLIELLHYWDIPFIAFRSSVPGQSTGPHIHIGPRSERIPLDEQ